MKTKGRESLDKLELKDKFQQFLDSLSVFELAALAHDLRKHPEDREYLNLVLVTIGEKGKEP